MQIVNNSTHLVSAGVFKALPYEPDNVISKTGDVPQGKPVSITVPPGDYYVSINVGSLASGALQPGTNIARTGGVSSDATVTLTQSDRIVIT